MTSEAVDPVELYRDFSVHNSAFNHDASDKMQLLGQGELPPPASCFVCGSGNVDAGYVNFGIWAEFIGNLIICAPCLTQAAELIDCLAPSVKGLMLNTVEKVQNYAKSLEVELEDAKKRLAAFSVLLGSVDGVISSNGPISDDSDSDAEGVAENDSAEGITDSESIESDSDLGPHDFTEPAKDDITSSDGLIRI